MPIDETAGLFPDAATRVFGVIGDPVSHSLSPVMHNAAFAHIGYNGVYATFRTRDVAGALCGVRALGIGGLSVTIPHKEAVMDHLDELDRLAAEIGAVNTVVNREGHLLGYNSDCTGAISALSRKTTVRGKRAALLGSGGGARAIGFGLRTEGASVTVVNRTPERGERLARDLDADFIPLNDFNGKNVDILINTTSVGMTPHVDGVPVPASVLEPEMVVMDIVYNPLKTAFLKAAARKGCMVIDGLAMFIGQGAFQFELWTGKKAPLEIMERAVRQALQSRI